MGDNEVVNITSILYDFAEDHPEKPAFLHPVRLTFGELIQEIDRFARGLWQSGIKEGTRTIVLIKPGIDLFAVTLALFRIGAIPVMIDPGMGRRRMTHALSGVQAEAFIGIPKAHLLRYLSPMALKTIKIWINTGSRLFWRGSSLKRMSHTDQPMEAHRGDPDELAAIFFTSGSTGAPKGVLYKKRMLQAQIKYLKTHFKYTSEEIDLCTYPLIGLLIIGHGISIVLADMDMMHPATLRPQKVIKNIQDFGCTHMFCSPMVLHRLASHGISNNIKLGSLKRIMTAGAPVSAAVLRNIRKILPSDAEIHTPYGATEALPVTDIVDKELLGLYENQDSCGEGICVGYPLKGIEIRIISITDDLIKSTGEMVIQPENMVGEITISGPNVTEAYWADEEANKMAKVFEKSSNTTWHRMGDLGRIDREGRLWFYGRKSHRVQTKEKTYFTIPVEAVFNRHPEVSRTALVGVKRRKGSDIVPVICIEPLKNKKRRIYLQEELRSLASEQSMTGDIKYFLFHRKFPVDPRHNAKIFREKLTMWANNKLSI